MDSHVLLKTETIAAYDRYAEEFDARFNSHMHKYGMAHADAFLSALNGRHVLDVGSGGGTYAAYFVSKGCKVLCVDPSAGMCALCTRRGLQSLQTEMQSLDLPIRFDGIWAHASFLHLQKSDLPSVIARLERHLVPGGVLGCAVKEGEGERLESHKRFPNTLRFFSYFSDEEFRFFFEDRFELLRFERAASSDSTIFLKYIFRHRAA